MALYEVVDWEEGPSALARAVSGHLGHKARRRMCPLYVAGLIGPGERKSVQPMASRAAAADYDQLHHFVGAGVWDEAPLEAELLVQADRLIGGADAVLVIDDTALPKKGKHSVGVAPQYATMLGKQASCQTAGVADARPQRGAGPVALRLYLPEVWAQDYSTSGQRGGPRVAAALREQLRPFYSDTGRPSIDPERMIRMLIIIGYCMGIRSERRLCERSTSTWHIDGSAGWGWTATCRIARISPRTGMAASATAISCADCFEATVKRCMAEGWWAATALAWTLEYPF